MITAIKARADITKTAFEGLRLLMVSKMRFRSFIKYPVLLLMVAPPAMTPTSIIDGSLVALAEGAVVLLLPPYILIVF